MKYKSFQIKNFKGIKDATINLDQASGAAVFALVGLNESGKTTVLEAIHSFSPDDATGDLLGGGGIPINDRVPRHLISIFTGSVSVSAVVALTEADKQEILAAFRLRTNLELNIEGMPSILSLERADKFVDGDFVESTFTLRENLEVRSSRSRKWRPPDSSEAKTLRQVIYNLTPDIAYFPTFVFEFPKKIYLTPRGDEVDRFYRTVFQDILDYDGRGLTIEKDVIRRVRSEKLTVSWLEFLTAWKLHDDQPKLDHVMARAGAAVTNLVFGRWNKIFGEDTRGKEIIIPYDVEEGEVSDDRGVRSKTKEHDVAIKFQIRDGTRRFDVNDRSLGFRWFFAFMLFTQFRVARAGLNRKILFLFDEPASNLHAAAQQKLVECFPEIARDDHMLMYSTHSHYMIEPKWLEQTFIVTNRADAPPSSSVLDDVSLDDESLDIKVSSYRSFVNEHPNQTSYFQPILDRLQVVPSRFDVRRSSVILEGKSDYYILRYALELAGIAELPLLPALGAGTLDALAALHVGWNLDFLFLLDGDKEGASEQRRYSSEYGIAASRLVLLSELAPGLKIIEDLIDNAAALQIASEFGLKDKPHKGQIRRFFQERLASGRISSISPHFDKQSRELLKSLQSRLGQKH